MKSLLFLTHLHFFFCIAAFSQPVFFEKTFGTVKNDFCRSIKQTNDGCIYLAGFSDNTLRGDFDITLTKLDGFGNFLWTKYYGDSLNDYGFSLIQSDDGNFLMCGEKNTLLNGIDAFLMKLDTAGNMIWYRNYSSPLNESVKSIVQTYDGDYVLCGFQNSPIFSNDAYLIKTDNQGILIWERTFDNGDNDVGDKVIEPKPGEYLMVNDMKRRGRSDYDIQLIKLDSFGLPVWERIYGDSATDGCQGVIRTNDNKYFFYGESGQPFDFILGLTDSLGNAEWIRHIGSVKSDAAFSALEDSDGAFILTGYSNGYNVDGRNDLVVFKVDRSGNLLWLRSYGDAGIDIGYEIIEDVNGEGYLIAGKTFNMLNQNEDYYLLHVDKLGEFNAINQIKLNTESKIYPNPAKEFLVIENDRAFCWEIININGEVVRSQSEYSNNILVNSTDFVAGMYFVKLIYKNQSIETKKMVISH